MIGITKIGKGDDVVLREMRIAVCGELPTTCEALRGEGIFHIDGYADSLDLSLKLRKGEQYHLILIHAPRGAGLGTTEYSYKTRLEGEWETVPVFLMNEPAFPAELDEIKAALYAMVAAQEKAPGA